MRLLTTAFLMLFLLSVSVLASAAPSKALLEAIVDTDVTLTLTNDKEVQGKITKVLENSVIFFAASGDVSELATSEIVSARVTSRDQGAAGAPPAAPQPTRQPTRAQTYAPAQRPASAQRPAQSQTVAQSAAAHRAQQQRYGHDDRRYQQAPPANPRAAGRGLRIAGGVLLVPGVALTVAGIALVAESAGDESLYGAVGMSTGAVALLAGVPLLALGTTLTVVGKKKRNRAIAAAEGGYTVSFSPSFAQGRPGAQVGFQF